MKTKVMTVTPEMAVKAIDKTQTLVADGKFRQRTISNPTVEQYARAMREGKWILTHQGIAIGDNGAILDGQHRLEAVARSGVSVDMLVSTDVPLIGFKNGYEVMTIDAVDRGRARDIGSQLTIGHGIKSGRATAAVCRALAIACTGNLTPKVSVTDTLHILYVYENELAKLQSIDHTWINNAAVSAGLVMGIAAGQSGVEFATSYLLGEHKYNDPANILKRWLVRNSYTSSSQRVLNTLYGVAHCVKAQFDGVKMEKNCASYKSLAWLIDQQGRRANKIRGLFEVTTNE